MKAIFVAAVLFLVAIFSYGCIGNSCSAGEKKPDYEIIQVTDRVIRIDTFSSSNFKAMDQAIQELEETKRFEYKFSIPLTIDGFICGMYLFVEPK